MQLGATKSFNKVDHVDNLDIHVSDYTLGFIGLK